MKLISKNSVLNLSEIHVMGILNVTPDSFFDGGMHNTIDSAVKQANFMIEAGASIIDIGGESTRPNAEEVGIEQELARVIPITEAIARRFEVWISVNTSKPEVIRESAQMGANIINDIRSLGEPGALEAVVETGLSVCLMHMQGTPKIMQKNPKYTNVLSEVNDFFNKQIIRCKKAGIVKERIVLDPGFGFGKNLSHNYELLSRLSYFHHFNLPLLVGMSRKSMIGKLLNSKPCDSLNGSLACAVIAAMQGACIIRVHDVKETVEVLRIVKTTLLSRKNKFYE